MTGSGRTVRRMVVGVVLAVIAGLGFAACGSSTKTQPNAPAGQPAGQQSPASTTPPTTAAPSSGGASF